MTHIVWDFKAQFEEYKDVDVFDCMLAEYVLFGGSHPLTQEATLAFYHVETLEELHKKQLELFETHHPLGRFRIPRDLKAHHESPFPTFPRPSPPFRSAVSPSAQRMDSLRRSVLLTAGARTGGGTPTSATAAAAALAPGSFRSIASSGTVRLFEFWSRSFACVPLVRSRSFPPISQEISGKKN